jgi:hypothetical protein
MVSATKIAIVGLNLATGFFERRYLKKGLGRLIAMGAPLEVLTILAVVGYFIMLSSFDSYFGDFCLDYELL